MNSYELGQMDLKNDIARPIMNLASTPMTAGIGAGAISFPLIYAFNKYILRNQDPSLRSLIISAAIGGITTATASKDISAADPNWVEKQLGPAPYESELPPVVEPDTLMDRVGKAFHMDNKTASDWDAAEGMPAVAAAWAAPVLNKTSTMAAVNLIPHFSDGQSEFLRTAIANSDAISGNHTSLENLSSSFTDIIGGMVGNLVPLATRSIEGAIFGSAFAPLIGAPAGSTRWIQGAAAMSDALWGNKLMDCLK